MFIFKVALSFSLHCLEDSGDIRSIFEKSFYTFVIFCLTYLESVSNCLPNNSQIELVFMQHMIFFISIFTFIGLLFFHDWYTLTMKTILSISNRVYIFFFNKTTFRALNILFLLMFFVVIFIWFLLQRWRMALYNNRNTSISPSIVIRSTVSERQRVQVKTFFIRPVWPIIYNKWQSAKQKRANPPSVKPRTSAFIRA